MDSGDQWELITESADVNSDVTQMNGSKDKSNSNGKSKRAQSSHAFLRYSPSNGSPVDLWFENGTLKSSRELTDEEKNLFGKVKTQEDQNGGADRNTISH